MRPDEQCPPPAGVRWRTPRGRVPTSWPGLRIAGTTREAAAAWRVSASKMGAVAHLTIFSNIGMTNRMNLLQQQDPEIWQAIDAEARRQQDGLEMIASENYTSPAIMQAVGSVLTNKYAEGYPGRRYYGGCEHVDVVETLAIERAKALFGAEAANVQPHSGSQANFAVYLSCLAAGRCRAGAGSCPRRPLDPRHEAQR